MNLLILCPFLLIKQKNLPKQVSCEAGPQVWHSDCKVCKANHYKVLPRHQIRGDYVLILQSCLTLWDPMNCSSLGSSVHGILQARLLEWVAMPFSMGFSWLRDGTWVSSIFSLQLDSLPTEPPGKRCRGQAITETQMGEMEGPQRAERCSRGILETVSSP